MVFEKTLCFFLSDSRIVFVIKVMITDRISSLPIPFAEKKGFFADRNLEVDIRTCVDYKGIVTLLESGRIDACELPTTVFLYECLLRKSNLKKFYKGCYLSHAPLNFFAKFSFKPYELALNQTYDIPVSHIHAPERFFAEKFFQNYFPDKAPRTRYLETPYYLFEKTLRSATSLGMAGDSIFHPFLNKFHSLEKSTKTILPDLAGKCIPSTMLVFSGQFATKFPKETDAFLRSVRDSIECLAHLDADSIDALASDPTLQHLYSHYRFGETKQALLQNTQKKQKIFHWKGDSGLLVKLLDGQYFPGIKRTVEPGEIQGIMDFGEIWDALDKPQVLISQLPSFRTPNTSIRESHRPKMQRKQNYIRTLIFDMISLSLDVLDGKLQSRLFVDENLRIDNRIRAHINNMLDCFSYEIYKLNERVIELENINSILEIKLDRSSVNLQYSEERYRYLFEFSREALIIVDTDTGEIIESNLQFRLMSGYSRTDLSRVKIDDLIVGQNLQSNFYTKKDRSDSMLQIPDGEMILKDGSRLSVDISVNSMLVSPKKKYQIIFRDNRERIESEKAKHEFISNISHELRSPMTNIRGYFELLAEEPSIRSKPEIGEMLDIIDKNTKRLTFLIENLLKIEKDTGEVESEATEIFDPAVVVEDVIHMNSHLYQEKKLQIRTELEKGNQIKGIRFEFSQIVSNLFVNAIKYTPSGEVSVCLWAENGQMVLTVSDTGLGIPEKYRATIFDRFYRIPSPENKKIGGTGLGLSITRSLVEKMGGEISFTSEVGKGTVFKVEVKRIP